MSTPSLLHPRNAHHGRYDFTALTKAMPALTPFIAVNPAGEPTIDFTDSNAVMMLNRALLAHCYKVKFWQLPEGYLCPPVPGRADYVHYLADLLAINFAGNVPHGKHITLLDVGTGANVIYPIIASHSYGWQVCGSESDPVAFKSAQVIVASNPKLRSHVRVVQQHDNAMFSGVIMPSQRFHLTMCNPPFFASQVEAEAASSRKWANLGKAVQGHQRNFAGQQHELWCQGGELAFISQMITESQLYKSQVCWFTSLVSQQKHLAPLQKLLRSVGAVQSEVIEMRQGQKVSRILAWSFLSAEQQQHWCRETA